jgi:hypothetical protein
LGVTDELREQMEIEVEVQDFSEAKKISRAVLEFEDYAIDWWKQCPHKRFIKNWEELKNSMEKRICSKRIWANFASSFVACEAR